MDKRLLLGKLPQFKNDVVLIQKNQSVRDIIKEVLDAHECFKKDYDLIADEFLCDAPESTARALFNFCKTNVRYQIEPEARQTTKSPAAIIALGDSIGGDCKHYAGFIGGVLDALRRKGCPINFNYRFASYDMFDATPQHVFIVVNDRGREIWVDPVLPTFDDRSVQPYHKPVNKKPKNSFMPLLRISGVDDALAFEPLVTEVVAVDSDTNLTPELEGAIRVLLYYGVMNTEGKISDKKLQALSTTMPIAEFEQITQARQTLQRSLDNSAAIGSIFDTIWRGVKKVSLAVPRNAFLSLVALNVFGYGTKLYNSIYQSNGSYYAPNQDRLYKKWYSLGGDWQNLENAIKSGNRKQAILGKADVNEYANRVGVLPAAVPAWVATASAIVAAIMPLVKELLAAKQGAGQLDPGIDPTTGLPYGLNTGGLAMENHTDYFGGIGQYIRENPLTCAGLGLAGFYLYKKFKGR